jgi:hypothetical protein
MTKKYDVEPTAQVIDDAAKTLAECSKRLQFIARDLRQSGDWVHVSSAANELANIMQNVRFDLSCMLLPLLCLAWKWSHR